jgi:quercetin dioxygenase-like cupin family protein
MRNAVSKVALTAAVVLVNLVVSRTIGAQDSGKPGRSGAQTRVALSQALSPMESGHLKVTVVEVSYGPGGSSTPHRHPCPVIGYVTQGALRTQVKGEAEHIYRAGESFYEAANGVHEISANASDKEAARFVAFFVCDHDAPLSSTVPPSAGGK